jgi:DNA-binding MarR family transcriptional regulator
MAEQENSRGSASDYWYSAEDDEAVAAITVLRALRRFRATDQTMRHRTEAEMDMNETDLAAIRHLIAAEAQDETVSPKKLSDVLGITTAATAKLLARLVASGHVRREPNPRDGRAQVLFATPNAHSEVRLTLGAMHRRMLEVAEQLTLPEQRAVIDFLDEMSAALTVSESGSRPN